MQLLALVTLAAIGVEAARSTTRLSLTKPKLKIVKRQDVLPANITDYQTFTSPNGFTVRYKEPGKAGVCETTPGVNSYSGYIDLGQNMHSFFYFFESRRDPANDPISLWLNGGPGSDSQIGLYQELGPCNVTEDLVSQLNPYSWTNVSNFIFLSQPFGVGFSYETEAVGSLNNVTGSFQNASVAPADGRYPTATPTNIDTTELAAQAGWEVIQAIYNALPQLDGKVKSKVFNLWTESYGGHYGPVFYDYFQQQNNKLASGNGSSNGTHLEMNALGIGNGIISSYIQTPYYPEFAVNNTYGIKSYNDTIYQYTQIALNMPNGCLQQIEYCMEADRSTFAGQAVCTEAENMCRDNVEGIYYNFGGRGVYDIRHPYKDPTPPEYFVDYLNLPSTQQALGVSLNYTEANDDVYYGFQQTGDFVYPDFLDDLTRILNSGVRVSLFYGDADYICNWFGGQAVSLAVNYTNAAQFRSAGYVPFVVNGVEYGEVRQYGNFSFTRIYEAGHEVPYYQPEAALALFNRSINLVDIATGNQMITADLKTNGSATATHTESFVALPSSTSSGGSSPSASAPSGASSYSSGGAAGPTSTNGANRRYGAVPMNFGLW